MKKYLLAAALVAVILPGCNKGIDPSGEEENGKFKYDVEYKEDDSNFCNPERGLYTPNIKYFRNGRMPVASTESSLRNLRKQGKTFSFSEFYIMDFVNKDLSEEVLDFIRNNFEVHRQAGVKTIVRFAYSDGYAENDHPWDAPCEQTLRHVAQLKPIFQEYWDVIYVLQYGFVGSWGEGYYTDYYGMNPKHPEDYESRTTLMYALLDALPENRQIAVRYPMYKRGILGMELKDTITAATAFGNSAIARVAAFNDCFVSSVNDVGTYNAAGDREMWQVETNYVSMGGETCDPNTRYCNCDNSYDNLKKYHWTYLNDAYHTGTHNVWRSNGCFEDIVKRLGYRFVLKGAAFKGDFKAGGEMTIKLDFENKGFASIINERPLQWVIVNETNPSEKYVITSPKDPREWKGSCSYIYSEKVKLPEGLKSGQTYKICLNLPDAAPTLCNKPDFSIRLANKDVWEEATGYNVLTKKEAL